MKLSQFKFKLPEEKIALHPTKYRDESRLMVLHSILLQANVLVSSLLSHWDGTCGKNPL